MRANLKRSKNGFTDIYRREMGLFQPRNVARRFSASEVLMKRINLYGRLHGHKGCVNAVEFNSTGDFLVSGSDDKLVIFWDWKDRCVNFSYLSGHLSNIFQTRIMPFTDDRKIVTSSADGQVRLGQIFEDGRIDTKRLGNHQGRVHKLAVEPGSPYIIYSCGEDGFVQHFDLRSDSATLLFYCSSFTENSKQPMNSIMLNSIVIDPRNPNYFAVGGSDEYARVYDIRKCHRYSPISSDTPVDTFCPHHLTGRNNVLITGLAYSNTSELLISYNEELIYLFEKNMGLGPSPMSIPPEDLQKREKPQVYSGHKNSKTVKGVNFFGPNDEYVMSGSDCGHIFIWKKKGGKLVRLMIGDRHIVNQLEPHPHIPLFATCGIEKSVKLWAPIPDDFPPLPDNAEKIIEANMQGREDHSRMTTLTPDVIMHVLRRLQRQQTLAFRERRYNAAAVESDEEEGETNVLGLSNSEGGNQRECNIS